MQTQNLMQCCSSSNSSVVGLSCLNSLNDSLLNSKLLYIIASFIPYIPFRFYWFIRF